MELPLVLALASALTWGAGDFFGGLATREAKAVGTTLISQLVGLVGLVIVSLLGAGGSFVGRDLAWGTAAGLCAVTGLGMFYEAMGRGAFGPVASITSVVSGGIPIVVGLVLGERPPFMVLIGVYVAVVAIWLIAGEKTKPGEPRGSRSALVLAVGAGTFFGGYFVLLSRAGGESGLWPLVAGRVAAALALGLTILVIGYGKADASWLPPRRSLKLAAIAGVLDASANALYFYASREGLLSVVAVIASMYPASTILLARVALRETVNRRRLAGMAAGLAAVSIIARGSTAGVDPPRPDSPAVHAASEPVVVIEPENGIGAPTSVETLPSADTPTPPELALTPTETAPAGTTPTETTPTEEDFFTEPIPVSEPVEPAETTTPDVTTTDTATVTTGPTTTGPTTTDVTTTLPSLDFADTTTYATPGLTDEFFQAPYVAVAPAAVVMPSPSTPTGPTGPTGPSGLPGAP